MTHATEHPEGGVQLRGRLAEYAVTTVVVGVPVVLPEVLGWPWWTTFCLLVPLAAVAMPLSRRARVWRTQSQE